MKFLPGKTNIKEYICMEELEGFKSVNEIKEKGKELLESGVEDFKNNEIDENIEGVYLRLQEFIQNALS